MKKQKPLTDSFEEGTLTVPSLSFLMKDLPLGAGTTYNELIQTPDKKNW